MKLLVAQNEREALNPMLLFTESHAQKIAGEFPDLKIVVAKKEELGRHVGDADVVIALSPLDVAIEVAKCLKWIHVTSAGVDRHEALMKSDILVTNSSGVHSIPIAEHVFGFMLMFARNLNHALKFQIAGRWVRNVGIQNISELHGKTIGIIGLGRIGKKIAELAKAFNMQVLAVVRQPRQEKNVDRLFTQEKLNEVLRLSDYVVSCLPLTKETRHMFDSRKFSLMKSSAFFINIGRGGTVKEEDLVKALKERKIAGAGLDVFEYQK